MTDDYKDLQERMDNPPLSWCPKGIPDGFDAAKCIEERQVFGTIESIEERTSTFGPYRMVVVIDGSGRRIQLAGLGTVLVKRFASVEVGQRLGVRFDGTKPSSVEGAEDYDDYNVVVG